MHPTTIPNKESVRRISVLHHASYCYLLVIPDDPQVYIHANIDEKYLDDYRQELADWCGMKFQVQNESGDKEIIKNIKQNGEKILPIRIE